MELGQNGAYMSGFSSTDHNTAIQAFAAGQTAMLYCGSWWSRIAGGTDNGFTLDVIQLPLMEGLTDNVSVQLCADIALLPTKDANESSDRDGDRLPAGNRRRNHSRSGPGKHSGSNGPESRLIFPTSIHTQYSGRSKFGSAASSYY